MTRPNYFLSIQAKQSVKIQQLLNDDDSHNYEAIEDILGLRNRKAYMQFFELYQIPLLIDDKERAFIDQIYSERNYFAHNANRKESKKLNSKQAYLVEPNVKTRAKKLRTKLEKLIPTVDSRVKLKVFG